MAPDRVSLSDGVAMVRHLDAIEPSMASSRRPIGALRRRFISIVCLSLSYNSRHRRPTASKLAIAARNVEGFTGTLGDRSTLSISLKFIIEMLS